MKHIGVVGVLLLSSVLAFAQETPKRFLKRKFISSIEVSAGVSRMRNTGYYEDSMQPKYEYMFGAGLGHAFSKTFEFKGRVSYELKGCEIERHGRGISNGTLIDETHNILTNNQYLMLSAAPTFRLFKQKRVIVGVWGFYGFLKKTKVTDSYTDNITNTTTTQVHTDPRNFYTRRDYGVAAFAGYAFPISTNKELAITFQYSKSLTDFKDVFSQYFRYQTMSINASFTFNR